MRRAAAVIALGVALLGSGSHARAGDWQPYGPANGGIVVSTHPTLGGRAMIASSSEGLFSYFTQDAGAHWVGNPWSIGAFSRPHLSGSIAYLSTDRSLVRSTDEGRSWGDNISPWVLSSTHIAGVNPANAEEVVVLFDVGNPGMWAVAHTLNGGKFWRGDYPAAEMVDATVDWSTRTIYAVATDGAIWRRAVDAYGVWQSTPANAAFVRAGHGVVLYGSKTPPFPGRGALFRSTDGGATFAQVAEASIVQGRFTDVAFSTLASRVYALDDRHVLRSDDGGATWMDGAFVLGLEQGIAEIAVDAVDTARVYVATDGGVLTSADAGATLGPLDHATGAPGRSRSIAVDAASPLRQWLVKPHLAEGELRLERTVDGGTTWTALPVDDVPIAASRQRANTLFGHSFGGEGFSVSPDGGTTWSTTFRPFPNDSFRFNAFAQGGVPAVLALGGTRTADDSSHLFVSTTDGETFTERTSPVPRIDALAIAPTSSATMYVGGHNFEPGEAILWRSTDGAATWQPIGAFAPRIFGWLSNAVYAIAVDPRDAARVYVGLVYPDNLMRSDDGGATWTRITTGLGAGAVTSIAIDPANPDTLYAAVYLSGVFRSTDRGATWQALDTGLRDDSVRQVLLDPHRPGRLYAATNSGVYQADLTSGLPAGRRRAIEYYHAAFDHYFVSSDLDEIGGLDDGVFQGWLRTGNGLRVAEPQAPGNLGTCRFFGVGFGALSSHFYTPYPAECDGLKSDPKWQYEKIAFGLALPDDATRGCAPGMRPLFRAWNVNRGGAPNHRYTTDPLVLDVMITSGWMFEGEAPTRVFACVPVE